MRLDVMRVKKPYPVRSMYGKTYLFGSDLIFEVLHSWVGCYLRMGKRTERYVLIKLVSWGQLS